MYRNIHCFKCHTGYAKEEDMDSLLNNFQCFSLTEKDDLRYTYSFKLHFDEVINEILVLDYSRMFPFLEYFKIPNDYKLSGKETFYKLKLNKTSCKCDRNCIRRRDCCPDSHWNERDPLPLNEYLKLLERE